MSHKFEKFIEEDTISLVFEDKEEFKTVFYFMYHGKLPNLLYVQSTLISLIQFSAQYECNNLNSALECEYVKILWRRKQNEIFQTFDEYVKKNGLSDQTLEVKNIIKRAFEQVYLTIKRSSPTFHVVGGILFNELASDIVFLVEENRVFGHKAILTRSDYFKALFSFGDQINEKEVVIEEEERPFLAMMYYIYTGELDPQYSEQSLVLLELSHKFSIENRIRHLLAVQIYEYLLNEENLKDVYEIACAREDPLLKYACEVYIGQKLMNSKVLTNINGLPPLEQLQEFSTNEELVARFFHAKNDFELDYKLDQSRNLIVLGDSQCGKSTLISHYTKNIDTLCHVNLTDAEKRLLQLNIIEIDLNQDNYKQILANGDVFIICYSVTEEKTFSKVKEIVKLISAVKDGDFHIVLAALKMDIPFLRVVSSNQGLNLASELNASYFEVATLFDRNVTPLIIEAAQLAYTVKPK